jgi:hypothetical protein
LVAVALPQLAERLFKAGANARLALLHTQSRQLAGEDLFLFLIGFF